MSGRFVILIHDTPDPADRHFDLFFEWDQAAPGKALFALRRRFEPEPAWERFPVTRQADHRARYLDYEGEISGGRGSVTRWDAGTFEGRIRPDDAFTLELSGSQVSGRFEFGADSGEGRLVRRSAP